MSTKYALGWLPDLPDIRDFEPTDIKAVTPSRKPKHYAVADWFANKSKASTMKAAPSEANLVKWFSPIEDQRTLGSCTANAGVGLLEYFENRAFGNYTDHARLFVYKVTRNLLGWTGDTGAYLRSTMKAMALFGAPPEAVYPYDIGEYDREPTAFHYSYAQNYQSISYFRLDQYGMTNEAILERIKIYIANGYPSMFGFSVYNFGNAKGEFAFPTAGDSLQGGHAVVAMGYNDSYKIGPYTGALRIRNSWGTGWGDGGYGWLPYEYVLKGLAEDFWSLFKAEYIDSAQFE